MTWDVGTDIVLNWRCSRRWQTYRRWCPRWTWPDFDFAARIFRSGKVSSPKIPEVRLRRSRTDLAAGWVETGRRMSRSGVAENLRFYETCYLIRSVIRCYWSLKTSRKILRLGVSNILNKQNWTAYQVHFCVMTQMKQGIRCRINELPKNLSIHETSHLMFPLFSQCIQNKGYKNSKNDAFEELWGLQTH